MGFFGGFWFCFVFFFFAIVTVKIRKTGTGTSYQKIQRASNEWQRILSVIASDAENFKNDTLWQTRKKKTCMHYPPLTATHTHTQMPQA